MKLNAYYKGEQNEWVKMTRHEIHAKSHQQRKEFKEFTGPWYVAKSIKSLQLYYDSGHKTFHFMPKQGAERIAKYQGMTITHHLAQEVLSEMRYMKLFLKDTQVKPYKNIYYNIEVTNTYIEQRMKSGHWADVLILFEKPYELSLKWKGFFTIEVFVTHQVDGNKSLEAKRKGVPMIELRIPEEFILKKSPKEVSQQQEEELKQALRESFFKGINADLLYSHTEDAYKESKTIQEKNKVIEKQANSLKELKKDNHQLSEEVQLLKDHVTSLKKNLLKSYDNEASLLNHKTDLLNRIYQFRKRSFLGKVLQMLIKKKDELI